MEKDPFFNPENENDSFFNFLRRTDFKNPLEEKDCPIREEHSLPWIFFLAELVHRIKNPLVSIKTFTELLEKKVNDAEYRESFYKVVSDDIERIDGVLNGLLNYVKVNTPLNKSNSIHQILEEALKRFEASFEDKKIKIFKRESEKHLRHFCLCKTRWRKLISDFQVLIEDFFDSCSFPSSENILSVICHTHDDAKEILPRTRECITSTTSESGRASDTFSSRSFCPIFRKFPIITKSHGGIWIDSYEQL